MAYASVVRTESETLAIIAALPKKSASEKYADELELFGSIPFNGSAVVPILVGFQTFKNRINAANLVDREARSEVWSKMSSSERKTINEAITVFEDPSTDPKVRELTSAGVSPVAGSDKLAELSLRQIRDTYKIRYVEWFGASKPTGLVTQYDAAGNVEQEFGQFRLVGTEPVKSTRKSTVKK